MRTLNVIILFFMLSVLSKSMFAQGHNGLYGNEWIDYTPGKQYYKVKVHEDGMYRVSATVLQQAGANISSINLSGLQMFHEGVEIPIHVEDSSGLLSYVQFYGKKNTGAYDAHLYNDPTHHFNKKYSLFQDTATYFLTWGATASTKHFVDRVANVTNLPAKEQYFMHTNTVVYSNTWNAGQRYQIATERLSKSTFEYGEGYGSSLAATSTISVPSEHPYLSGPSATVDVQCWTPSYLAHVLDIKVGATSYATHSFNQMNVGTFSATLPPAVIQTSGTPITIEGSANSTDEYYIAYVDLHYPRMFDFDSASVFPFRMVANTNRKYLEIDNIDATNFSWNQLYLYDFGNNERIQCFYDWVNGRLLTDLNPSGVDRGLIFINEANNSSYQNVSVVNAVTFRDFSSSIYTPTDYVIITHPDLKTNSGGGNPIGDYKAYRESLAGGDYTVTEVDVQELYDQFAYGIVNHPLAVRHFGHYIKQAWTNPEYLYLIGKGRQYESIRDLPSNMLVPTFGNPASDQLLMASISSDEPCIATGRLSATTGDQVSTYLQKIQDVEAQRAAAQSLPNQGWTKNVVHLGGGSNANHQSIIQNHLDNMKTTIEAPSYAANVSSYFNTVTPIQVTQMPTLDSIIDNGVSMITFFSINDSDMGLPQDYNNYQKYPLILALGYYSGQIYGQNLMFSENFVFEPQAGAAVVLGPSNSTGLSALNNYAQEYYTGISSIEYGKGAAKAVKYAIKTLETGAVYSTTTQMACHYMTYHGDPAYKVADAAIASPVEYVEYYPIDELKVFPIPANSDLNIELSSTENTAASISLIDMLGRTIMDKKYSISLGENTINISVAKFLSGIYTLKVEMPNHKILNKKIRIDKE